ncbi:unnamed protein product, partial [marine sediment metagenome]
MMEPLLRANNDWQLITSFLTGVLGAQFGVTVLSNLPGTRVNPVVENVSADRYRLVIPIGHEADKLVVAVGTLDAKPPEILEKLLGLAVRYIREGRRFQEQRLDLDAYAQQVNQDFEELNWLRSLLQHLREHDQTSSAEDVAGKILLPLCTIIQAEEIILVLADQENTSPGQKVPSAGKVIVRVDPKEQIVDDQSCCQLVDRLREVAGVQSLVQNG